jgi:1-phosphofructokinase
MEVAVTGSGGRVAIFGPHPLLSVTIEGRGETDREDIHVHAAGQGFWVARMAGELGAEPVLCSLIGGETGALLGPLLDRLPGERRIVQTAAASGCYVIDRRSGERELVARAFSDPPTRHELDELFSVTCAAALESDVLVICNPHPGESLPLDVYSKLVTDVRQNGVPVVVDLSSPRLDSALEGSPDLVKLNDWELAQYVSAPVDTPARLRDAAERLRAGGAARVAVTRGGEPALVLDGERGSMLEPPRFEGGSHEGCGDSMVGGLAAGVASGLGWEQALILGAAAGAANFLRHGLGTGSRGVVDELRPRVRMTPLAPQPQDGG